MFENTSLRIHSMELKVNLILDLNLRAYTLLRIHSMELKAVE